jgi:hypothetical protein
MMERDVLSGTSFIGAAGGGMMIHFSRKRCISVSITRVIRARDRGAKILKV